jgi:DNA (cytosine-5)-methyltransferase 1
VCFENPVLRRDQEAVCLGATYRVLDLFAGIGGLSYGFEVADTPAGERLFQLVCAVEKDDYACETLRLNLERRGCDPGVVLENDLTVDETHSKIVDVCSGEVDLIVGGPPCQSFSSIGPRSAAPKVREKWIKDGRDLYYEEYVALVTELKPKFLVFENVKGILSKRDGDGRKYVDAIVEAIEECGYRLDVEGSRGKYLVLNTADYGVPQIRERMIIVANRLGLENPYPRPTHSKNGLVPGTLPWVTLRDAIGDLPPVKPKITFTGLSVDEQQRVAEENLGRYRGEEAVPYHWARFREHWSQLPKQGQEFLDFIKPRSDDALLTAQVARGQQATDIKLFGSLPAGFTSKQVFYLQDPDLVRLRTLIKYDMGSFKDKYRKQNWDSPCTTIFAHMQKDGNRFIHPDNDQARTLTVREAARVQSFPDDFLFTAPGNVRYKYIGNAVPPLLARAIAGAIAAVLKGSACP